jgi:MarR family transcriptional regulator, organic hydroperoxide resistance regulator
MSENQNLKVSRQLCFSVYSTAHAFNRFYKPILEPLGLTYPQYLAMLVLWDQDGLTVKEIGQHLHLDSGTLTPVLKRLQALGYVQRSRDLPDERQVRVTLTERGREIREQAAAGRREVVCALGRTEEQIQVLKRELDQLRDALLGQVEDAEDDVPREDAPTLITPAESQQPSSVRARATAPG